MLRRIPVATLLFLLAGSLCLAQSKPTKLRIRVVSRDAKVIGTGVGGAMVTVTDLASGQILARGIQLGGTGDTNLIMTQPRSRGARLFDTEGAAYFETVLLLAKPTRVEVSAEGPLNFPQSIQRSSKTLWLVPGVDMTGEGVVLEIHGFILDIRKPWQKTSLRAGVPEPVEARLTMTWGCPIEPGGLWDANKIRVTARVLDGGSVIVESNLEFSGEVSIFRGQVTVPVPGHFQLEVIAAQPDTENVGHAVIPLEVVAGD